MADELRVSMSVRKPLKFVGLGEVLFDVFEDGTATLGGAPLNVALHAHQLATAFDLGQGIVVSRVGDDHQGRQIVDALTERGMSTRYVQTDPAHRTGTVSVFMRNGEPGYQIERDAAWDFLERDGVLDHLAETCDAVCFGSLAQRSPKARETVRSFLGLARKAVRLYDVNLRRNTLTHERGYNVEILESSCKLASMVKVNSDELLEIAALFGIDTREADAAGVIPELPSRVMNRLSIPALIVTSGPRGTTLFARKGEFHGNFLPITLEDVHPVGAGDACTAGILFATVLGFTPDAAVDLGNRMGAWVASHRSATPKLSDDIASFIGTLAPSLKTHAGGLLEETA
jgi:fructokinase